MKRSAVLKIVVDIVMIVLFISMLFAKNTGMVYHEIAGTSLLVVTGLHVFLNRKWFMNCGKNFSSLKTKSKLMFVLNLGIALFTVIVIFTGMMISTVLFPQIDVANRALIAGIHQWLFYVDLAMMGVHLAIHAAYLARAFGQIHRHRRTKSVRQVILASLGVLFLCSFVYVQAANLVNGASDYTAAAANSQTTTTTQAQNQTSQDSGQSLTTAEKEETSEAATPTVQQATPAVTLTDYLSSLHCTGCGKHCPLSNPRCGVGEQQAQEATVSYNDTYGTASN
jgi:hypothetical protein